jgi:hypothetical protein
MPKGGFLSKITWIMVHGSAYSIKIRTLSLVFAQFDPVTERGNNCAHYLVKMEAPIFDFDLVKI